MQRYFTTPIYYANDCPHLGHFYTTVAADILARFFKLAKDDVKFVTGMDEHGDKIAQAAEKKGKNPQEYVDTISLEFRRMIDYAHTGPDDFIRTTEPRHHQTACAFWKKLVENDQIYLGHYEGWYAVRDEAFYTEDELILTPQGRCAPTGAAVEWLKEPCYFFRLSNWADKLLDYYAHQPDAIGPISRYNEVCSFIEGGLNDLAISRTRLSWGIPVPGVEGHVMYVWIDALTNYLTALGYENDEKSNPISDFWSQSTHIIGKDILRFHGVYWPAFLMAAGLPPPHRVFAHGWWMSGGQKMSKSLGNVIDPKALVKKFGIDRVRYFLFRHVRFGQDGDCTEDMLRTRTNQELADCLGNLLHRVLSFVCARLGGTLALPDISLYDCTTLDPLAQDLLTWGKNHLPHLKQLMEKQDIYTYLEEIYHMLVKGNQYMAELAPWQLIKENDKDARMRMHCGLGCLIHFLRDIALLLWPIMPVACQDMLEQVGSKHIFEATDLELRASHGLIGQRLALKQMLHPRPLFDKINEISTNP